MYNLNEKIDILFNRKVVVFSGEYGRSKSLSMTAFNFLAIIYGNIKHIYSNIPMCFKAATKYYDITCLSNTNQLMNLSKNSIINIDEMQRDLNTREFMSSNVKIINAFSVDMRKDNNILVGTIQYLDRLELSMSEIVQLVIIPTFINEYHLDKKKDIEMRLKNKDFWVIWKVIDRTNDSEFEFNINLYPYINFYDTNFKPQKMIVNHLEYIEKQEEKLSSIKYETLLARINEKIKANRNNWESGYVELIKKSV